jgi:hypothetical protein
VTSFAIHHGSRTPRRGPLTRMVQFLFPAKPPAVPTELERARAMREAARARYLDAVSRHDTREMHAYQRQFVAATNRALRLEVGR